ncbi:protein of unknown function [Streptomyces sp. KY75]|nr:protein of unknown function [Streptomyces sp. KY70]CAD5988590.1 protein of unknown function [Streptomyces sp. KY75]
MLGLSNIHGPVTPPPESPALPCSLGEEI